MASRKEQKQRARQQRLAAEHEQQQRRGHERRIKLGGLGAAGLFIAALVAIEIASGSGGSSSSGLQAPKLTKAELAAAPKQLAANLRQGNEVIDGSIQAKLSALRGVPVVVNQWASWCPNCKAEFPFFQRLSRSYQGKVAFVGLDSQDDRGSAEDFLKQYPVPYPSIFDQSASEAASIGAGQGWPTTIYFDRRGRRTYVHQGGYVTEATLRADIERHALRAG
jgi:thiol-disulfide isomerase/thioredoxin